MADYRKDWWQLEADESVDLSLPGIYEWRIGNEYIYVGQSARLKRRLNEYPNNVGGVTRGLEIRLEFGL